MTIPRIRLQNVIKVDDLKLIKYPTLYDIIKLIKVRYKFILFGEN